MRDSSSKEGPRAPRALLFPQYALACVLLGLAAVGQIGRGDTIYSEDFESGALGAEWTTSGTYQWRTQVTSANGPHAGNYHLTMDDNYSGSYYSRNEATLAVDLQGKEDVVLTFWAREWGDETHSSASPFTGSANFDGVAISEDGSTWHIVQSFSTLTSAYQEVVIDLDSAISTAGLSYTSDFRIRFNQYDNYSISSDGIGIDDVTITGSAADALEVTPESVLAADGAEGETFTPATQTLSLLNDGDATLQWRVQALAESWLQVSPMYGTLAAGTHAEVQATITDDAAGLPWNAQAYVCPIIFENVTSGALISREYQLTVRQRPAAASATPDQLLFFCEQAQESTQLVTLFNTAALGNADLDFSVSTSSGGAPVVDTVCSYANHWNVSNCYRGDIYEVTESTVLTLIESFHNFTGNVQLHFVVFESSSHYGVYDRILDQTVSRTGTGGGVYHASDPVNVPLKAGRFYIIATGWSAYISCAGESMSHPQPVSFGFQHGGYYFSSYPIGTTTSATTTSMNYCQRLTTADSWLSVAPDEGSVPPSDAVQLEVQADSTGLPVGLHQGTLQIDSNDPEIPTHSIRARLAVGDVVVVTLPGTAREGDDILEQQGMVSIPTAQSQDVTVELVVDDPTELAVPPSVVIPAGETNAVFDIAVIDDASSDGPQDVNVSISMAGFESSSESLTVRDNDVHRFAVRSVAEEQYLGTAFDVTLEALDPDGDTATGFSRAVSLVGGLLVDVDPRECIKITEVQPGDPDAVELVNVWEEAMDVSGWQIVIYDSVQWPDPVATFTIPSGTVSNPGDVFQLAEYGTAPGAYPQFYLGTNINWSYDMTTMAVVLLDGDGSLVDVFTASDPQQITNPVSIPAEHWTGAPVPALTGSALTHQRVGAADQNSNTDWGAATQTVGAMNVGLSVPFPVDEATVPVSSAVSPLFNKGMCVMSVTIHERAQVAQLLLDDGYGHTGESTEFSVVGRFSVDAVIGDDANTGLSASEPKRSIQQAIADSQDGDLILVSPGTYVENISFLGKKIAVSSRDPASPDIVAQTIIDGGGVGPVVEFVNSEPRDALLAGFTVTNGVNDADSPGGGINCIGASPTIDRCVIASNTGQVGGGLYCKNSPQLRLLTCQIRGNQAAVGGGLLLEHSSPHLENCLIVGNVAHASGGGMAGVTSWGSFVHCTIADNSAGSSGGGIASVGFQASTFRGAILWGNTAPANPQIHGLPPDVSYSCVEGGITGVGNIDADPLFVDAPNGDYHLTPSSPCIDAAGTEDGSDIDCDAEPRPYPISSGPLDMGCDEYVEYVYVTVEDTEGGADPPEGAYEYVRGTTMTFSSGTSSTGTSVERYAVAGWSGSGNIPASGSAGSTGAVILDADSAITWHWQHQVLLQFQPTANGTVNTPDTWCPLNSEITIEALPGGSYSFDCWRGDVTLGKEFDNPVTLLMYAPRSVYPEFIPTEGRGDPETDQTVEFTLYLREGWNTVTIPVTPQPSTDPAVIFANTPVSPELWTWDGTRYELATTLVPGIGYWIWADADCAVVIAGRLAESDLLAVQPGWNYTGGAGDYDAPDSDLIVGLPKIWDGEQYIDVQTMQMGMGYWFYAVATGDVNLGERSLISASSLAGYRDADRDGMADIHEFALGFPIFDADDHTDLAFSTDFQNLPVKVTDVQPTVPPVAIDTLTPSTYIAGPVSGQGGWLASSDGGTAPEIIGEQLHVYAGGTAIMPVAAFGEPRVWVGMRCMFPETTDLSISPSEAANMDNLFLGLDDGRSTGYSGLSALVWDQVAQSWDWHEIPAAAVQAGKWFDLAIEYDYQSATADVYVDSVGVAEGLPFSPGATGFAAFCYNAGNLTGTASVVIDDLTVSIQAPPQGRVRGVPVTLPVELGVGWNLVSFPVSSSQSPVSALGDAISGPAWYWNTLDQAYYPATNITQGRGYWINASSNTSVLLQGTAQVRHMQNLQPGWTLFGPQTDLELPASEAAWLWSGSGYETAGAGLVWGQGYWVHSPDSAQLSVQMTDRDFDGVPDDWETSAEGGGSSDLLLNERDDSDGDGLNTVNEYYAGTKGSVADTDADGLNDGNEILLGTDPLSSDAGSAWHSEPLLYETGLENGGLEPYLMGGLDGQHAWQVPNGQAQIVEDPVSPGTQALELGTGSGPAESVVERIFSEPSASVATDGTAWLCFDLLFETGSQLTSPGSSHADLLLAVNSQNELLFWTGEQTEAWVNTIETVTPSEWCRLAVLLNFNTRTFSPYLGNTRLGEFPLRRWTPNSLVRIGIGAVTDTSILLDSICVTTDIPAGMELDDDEDGLDDAWELAEFQGLGQLPGDNPDEDGLCNYDEWRNGTDPEMVDTDGDGLPDGWEVANGLDPLAHDDVPGPDTDRDGVPDVYEIANSFNQNSVVHQIETWGTETSDWEARGNVWEELSGRHAEAFEVSFKANWLPNPYGARARTVSAKFVSAADPTPVLGDVLAFDLAAAGRNAEFTPLSVRLRFHNPQNDTTWISDELLGSTSAVDQTYKLFCELVPGSWRCTLPMDDGGDPGTFFLANFNAADWLEVGVVRAGTDETDYFSIDSFRLMDSAAGDELTAYLGDEGGGRGDPPAPMHLLHATFDDGHIVFQIEESWDSQDPDRHVFTATIIPKEQISGVRYMWAKGMAGSVGSPSATEVRANGTPLGTPDANEPYSASTAFDHVAGVGSTQEYRGGRCSFNFVYVDSGGRDHAYCGNWQTKPPVMAYRLGGINDMGRFDEAAIGLLHLGDTAPEQVPLSADVSLPADNDAKSIVFGASTGTGPDGQRIFPVTAYPGMTINKQHLQLRWQKKIVTAGGAEWWQDSYFGETLPSGLAVAGELWRVGMRIASSVWGGSPWYSNWLYHPFAVTTNKPICALAPSPAASTQEDLAASASGALNSNGTQMAAFDFEWQSCEEGTGQWQIVRTTYGVASDASDVVPASQTQAGYEWRARARKAGGSASDWGEFCAPVTVLPMPTPDLDVGILDGYHGFAVVESTLQAMVSVSDSPPGAEYLCEWQQQDVGGQWPPIDAESLPVVPSGVSEQTQLEPSQVWRAVGCLRVGTEYSAVVASDPYTVIAPPHAPTVALSAARQKAKVTEDKGQPYADADLIADVNKNSLPDGTTSLVYTWYKVSQDGTTEEVRVAEGGLDTMQDTLDESHTAKGERWRVEVVARVAGTPSLPGSASVVIADYRPSLVFMNLSLIEPRRERAKRIGSRCRVTIGNDGWDGIDEEQYHLTRVRLHYVGSEDITEDIDVEDGEIDVDFTHWTADGEVSCQQAGQLWQLTATAFAVAAGDSSEVHQSAVAEPMVIVGMPTFGVKLAPTNPTAADGKLVCSLDMGPGGVFPSNTIYRYIWKRNGHEVLSDVSKSSARDELSRTFVAGETWQVTVGVTIAASDDACAYEAQGSDQVTVTSPAPPPSGEHDDLETKMAETGGLDAMRTISDPVNPVTGEFYAEGSFATAGLRPVVAGWRYSTQNNVQGVLGSGWLLTPHCELHASEPTAEFVRIATDTGATTTFTESLTSPTDPTRIYRAESQFNTLQSHHQESGVALSHAMLGTITYSSATQSFAHVTPDGEQQLFAKTAETSPRFLLVKSTDVRGNALTFLYEDVAWAAPGLFDTYTRDWGREPGYLVRVENDSGRFVDLYYTLESGQAVIDYITDDAGREVDFGYTAHGGEPFLTGVTRSSPVLKPSDEQFLAPAITEAEAKLTADAAYVYSDSASPGVFLMSSVERPGGQKLTNIYDSDGRVVEQYIARDEDGDEIPEDVLSADFDYSVPGQTTVVQPRDDDPANDIITVFKYATETIRPEFPAGCIYEEVLNPETDDELTTTFSWNTRRQMTGKVMSDGTTLAYVYEEAEESLHRLSAEYRRGQFSGGHADPVDLVKTAYEYFDPAQRPTLAALDLPKSVTVSQAVDSASEQDAEVVRTTFLDYLDSSAPVSRDVHDGTGGFVRGELWEYYTLAELQGLWQAYDPSSTRSLQTNPDLAVPKSYTVDGPPDQVNENSFTTEFIPTPDGAPAVITSAPGTDDASDKILGYYADGSPAVSTVVLSDTKELTVELGYDGKGRLYGTRDPLGRAVYQEFDDRGNTELLIGARTDLVGADHIAFTHDLLDNLTNVMRGTAPEDAADTVALARTFDRVGNLVAGTSRAGIATALSHDFRNRVTAVSVAERPGVDWDSSVEKKALYDDVSRTVVQEKYLDGQLNARTTVDVTGSNRAWREQRPSDPGTSCVDSVELDPLGRPAVATDPEGNEVRSSHDAVDRLDEAVYVTTDGHTVAYRSYKYNALGRVRFEYHNQDHTRFTEYRYNRAGRLAHIIGPEVEVGSIRRREDFLYDRASRLTDHYVWRDEAGEDRARTHYTYTDDSLVRTITTPDATTRWFEYNEAGMKTAELRSLQPCEVDDIEMYGLGTHRTEFKHNVRGELERKLVEAQNGEIVADAVDNTRTYHVFAYGYDDDGQLGTVTDSADRVWGVDYDNVGRVVEKDVTFGQGPQSIRYLTFRYEASDRPNCATVTVRTDFPDSSHPVVTRYHYDGRDNLRVIEEAYGTAQERVTETDYTGTDLVATEAFGDVRSRFEYEFDRLTREVHGTLNAVELSRSYDLFGNLERAATESGTSSSPAAELRFVHNANNQLRQADAMPLAGGVAPVLRHCDYAGGLALRTVEAGAYRSKADFGFSPEGYLDFVGVQFDGGQWQFPYVVDLRTTLGEAEAIDRACGTGHSLYEWSGYEAGGNLRQQWLYTDAQEWQRVLDATDTPDYDTSDRLTSFDADILGPPSTAYTYYEPFGYLESDGAAVYTYDDYGNRLTRTGGSTETYDYSINGSPDPLHRLQSRTFDGLTTAYQYDLRGNLDTKNVTGQHATSYTWDKGNRLERVDSDAPIPSCSSPWRVVFGYDPLGRRYAKHFYIWDDQASAYELESSTYTVHSGDLPVAEFDAVGNLLREMVWDPTAPGGIGGLVLLRSYLDDDPGTGERLYGEFRPVYDFRGNVAAMFNSDGELVERYEYDGFGRTRIFTAADVELADSAIGNTFMFSTKHRDVELALYHFGARYYDPETGRFISPDPLGFIDGPSPYLYVAGDPINWIDPWGYCAAAARNKAKSFGLAASEVAGAASTAYLSDNALGLPIALGLVPDPGAPENPLRHRIGAAIGHSAALVQGYFEFLTGSGMTVGGGSLVAVGLGLTVTGKGALVGLPAMGGGTVLTTKGLVFVTHGAVTTGVAGASLMKMAASPRGKGAGKEGVKKQGRERLEKKRGKKGWKPRTPEKPPKKHTPGRGHGGKSRGKGK